MGGLCSVHIIHFAQKHRYFQKLEEHGHQGSAPVNMDADRHAAGSVASTVILGTGEGKATLGA